MSTTFPRGTIALVDPSRFDKLRRYRECQAGFLCEIGGPQADQCVAALPPDQTVNAEQLSDGKWRIAQPTERQAAMLALMAERWEASAPDVRSISARAVSLDHSAQQAIDIGRTGTLGHFEFGIAFGGGPWTLDHTTNDEGEVIEVVLRSAAAPPKVAPAPAPAPPAPPPPGAVFDTEPEAPVAETAPEPELETPPKKALPPRRGGHGRPKGTTRRRPSPKKK